MQHLLALLFSALQVYVAARALVIDRAIAVQGDEAVKEWATKNLDAETRALVRHLNPTAP